MLGQTTRTLRVPTGTNTLNYLKKSFSQFYDPHELLNHHIHFVGSTYEFKRMLDYFEFKTPQVIGLDCESK
jgi:hypothetical protein